MNSYFASCEQQANPHLRGLPVGVCEHLGGIIIAPSVEAKRLGIKLGTTVWDARKIYPKIVLLPVDPDKYRSITARFLKILYDYSDKVEKHSIDEAFADITEIVGNNSSLPPLTLRGGVSPLRVRGDEGELSSWNNALLLGLEIKQRIRQEIGEWVSCSVGIGPNKLIAKIAADLDGGVILNEVKDLDSSSRFVGIQNDNSFLDRICVIRPEDIPMLYDCLNLTDVPGIGPRLERALHKLGIFSLRELSQYPLANLLNQFGVNGYFLHELAKFHNAPFTPSYLKRGEGELFTNESIKSMGHSYTLPKAISNLNEVRKLMLKLSEKIGRRMRAKGAKGNVIYYFHSGPLTPTLSRWGRGIKGEGRKSEWVGFSKQHKIKELINDGRDIYRAAFNIFTSFGLRSNNIQIKIMGVSVSGLRFDHPQEPLLETYKKPAWLVLAMDEINNKYGEFTIRRGRLLGIAEEWGKDTVGFGRMKELNLEN